MYCVDQKTMERRALEIYHLYLKETQPLPIDHYGEHPLSVGNGFFQMDDLRPCVISLCHPVDDIGLFLYIYPYETPWCHLSVSEGRWDALSLPTRWALWEQLNAFYSHESRYHPKRLSFELVSELIESHAIRQHNKPQQRKKLRRTLEHALRKRCSIYP